MAHYDCFNGDADGLCALHQLRLAQPCAATRVTGVKRAIALVQRVPAEAGDTVTVLDVSLAANREAVAALLARGVRVEYFDHHHPGEPLVHPGLTLHLDTGAAVCTSVLVDRHLAGAHRPWAVVGAYGDNLAATAAALAPELDAAGHAVLRELGEAINYNAYGETEADLLVPPAQLYEALRTHADPFSFAADPLARRLADHQRQDLALAHAVPVERLHAGAALCFLPAAPWARRVQGVWANALARGAPQRAHAVVCDRGDGSVIVSVRAPLARPAGTDALCRAFGGGGRAGAGGVDRLPCEQVEAFLRAFAAAFQAPEK